MRALIFAVLAAASTAVAALDIQEGSWEMTVSVSVDGMPGGLQPVTQTRCLTREDARDPTRLIGAGAGCEFSNKQDSGSQITFDVACTGQVPMRGSGSVRYSANDVEGTLEIAADTGGQRIMTRSQLVGRRLGECKP